MTLKKTIHDNTMETSPYSAVGNIPVYKRTNKKLNILGKTVASP
jgi:hypothetical protein